MALAEAYASVGNEAEAFRTMGPLVRSVTAPVDALELGVELAKKVGDPVAAELSKRAAELKRDPKKNQLFEAEHAIIEDEVVQSLVAEFEGHIIEGSIKPVSKAVSNSGSK